MSALIKIGKTLLQLEEKIIWVERRLAALAFLLIILLSLGQIITRNLFSSTIADIDILIRNLLLLIVFLGAALAVADDQHIKIELPLKLFRFKSTHYLPIILQLISTLTMGIFMWSGWHYLQMEWSFAQPHERWIAAFSATLPIGFLLLTYHFLCHSLKIKEDNKS